MTNLKLKKGYSLIELLVVLGIFALLATLASQAVVLTLRSSKKSESSIKVKDNLNYALGVMERQLRNAYSVTPTCALNKVDYVDNSGTAASFECDNTGVSDYYVASGSSRLTSTDIKVNPCSITCTDTSVTIS